MGFQCQSIYNLNFKNKAIINYLISHNKFKLQYQKYKNKKQIVYIFLIMINVYLLFNCH